MVKNIEQYYDYHRIEWVAQSRLARAIEYRATKFAILNRGLTTLPPEIGQLANLETLDVSGNKFTSLPSQIGNLHNLKKLNIGSNNLYSLPRDIKRLKNLQVLNIRRNNLTTLPPEIGELENLEELDLSNELQGTDYIPRNKISQLPPEINSLRKLKKLNLLGNPLPIPPEILGRIEKPETILNYYFSLSKKAKKPLNELKLLVVGQGSVGKTSIIKRIVKNEFSISEGKTDGIDVTKWIIETKPPMGSDAIHKNGSDVIHLNIWDFGGQEIMHATHQFFLTKRSLYLLVLDARLTQEENRVEYWLKIIQSFGGESPVLIVGNKTDQNPLDIDRTGLSKKYSNIVEILETSAATGTGIEALKSEIANQVESLPHVRDLLPKTWFTIKLKLEKLAKKKNYFTYDEYENLCNKNSVKDDSSKNTLIGFLHDLGVVLHFQDDPRLEALGILNPQWVTNGVYKILNSNELFQNKGTLTLPMLNKILNLPEYPSNKRLFIVDMMKKFELCYDIESEKSFLVPDLLPKDELYTGEWDEALAFQYHYNVLLPSIISRFIVRMNAFIHKTVWRSGVVLRSGGNTALVKADTEDSKIYIWVNGDENTRRDFLYAIRVEFDAIHKTIAKIQATEKVPLPKYPKAAPIDYRLLLQLEQKGILTYHVQAIGDLVEINVRELLEGVRPSPNQVVKVFVSYAHKDKSFVKKLAGELASSGMRVWWDIDRLKAGQDWEKEIEAGIKQCDYFLVVLTPEAVVSDWVGNEITYASNLRKTIIPLHLKKCNIPIGLIKKQYIDFQNKTRKAAIKELKELLRTQNVDPNT